MSKNKKTIMTFEEAREMVETALKETAYADSDLKEYGGGDGAEDIKPFLISREGDTTFGATVYPEGMMLFWVWADDGEQEEYENMGEAITAFEEATGTKRFVGPSKAMRDALEEEGLSFDWDKKIEDEDDLFFEGTYITGCDWQKCVIIDLRDEGDLSTKANVDAAISNQLDEAYEEFSIDEEMKMHMEGTAEARRRRGVPEAARLLEDMQEQDACLKRFAEVAEAVSSGCPVPPKEDSSTITVSISDAEQIVKLLAGLQNLMTLVEGSDPSLPQNLIDKLHNKITAAA